MFLTEQDHDNLLKNLMENMRDNIYFKDAQSRFLMVNKAYCEWTGLELDQIIGKTDFDLFAPEHAQKAFDDEQSIIATGVPIVGIEEKETWADGHVTWVSTTKMPLRSDDGRIIGTFGLSRNITEHKEAELQAAYFSSQVSRIKEDMEDDVRMAGELQKKFFPSSYPDFPKGAPPEAQCIEFLHRFELCRDVGGDYCAVTRISDHEAGIFLCDVSGIGVRAALVTALIRGIMQEILPLAGDPGTYLSRMNTTLTAMLRQEDVRLDVQACYLTIDVSTGRLRLANAGHAVPIRFCGDREAQWLFSADALPSAPLAVQEGTVYNTFTQTIQPGDAVVLYTDGLCSVINNMDDPFGEKRLIEAAHSLAGEPLADIFEGLKNDALAFAKSGQFTDDVCLVGFQLKGLMTP